MTAAELLRNLVTLALVAIGIFYLALFFTGGLVGALVIGSVFLVAAAVRVTRQWWPVDGA